MWEKRVGGFLKTITSSWRKSNFLNWCKNPGKCPRRLAFSLSKFDFYGKPMKYLESALKTQLNDLGFRIFGQLCIFDENFGFDV
jgi:hypothetical protein